MANFDYIEKNLYKLQEDCERISQRAGAPMPKLVAVTKSGSDEELLALIRAGALAIGENRPTELSRRAALIAEAGLTAELHEIGNLQSNKAKLVAPIATLTHSLCSLSLARALDAQGRLLSRRIPVLIEVNSAKEEQKGGIFPERVSEFYESLSEFKNLEIRGLMTMGPALSEEEVRPYFRKTRALFDNMKGLFGDSPILSMGMSDSFGVAIEEGSTLIRVGRRLFLK